MTSQKEVYRRALDMALNELRRIDPDNPVALAVVTFIELNKFSPPAPSVRHFPNAAEAIVLYESGGNLLQAAQLLRCSTDTARALLVAHGVKIRPQGPPNAGPDPRLPEMLRLRADGQTLAQIGAAFKITRERARQIFIKGGHSDKIGADNRPLTAAEKEAVGAYVAGESLIEASARLGVSVVTMRDLINRAGEAVRPSPKKGRDPKNVARSAAIVADYRANVPVKDIERRYVVSSAEILPLACLGWRSKAP